MSTPETATTMKDAQRRLYAALSGRPCPPSAREAEPRPPYAATPGKGPAPVRELRELQESAIPVAQLLRAQRRLVEALGVGPAPDRQAMARLARALGLRRPGELA